MNNRHHVIAFLMGLCLLMGACAPAAPVATEAVETATPQPSAMATLTPELTVTPTPTPLPVQIKSVSAEPRVVKNGDTIRLQIEAIAGGQPVFMDLSQLDTTQPEPVSFYVSDKIPYNREISISYGNAAANGQKLLRVFAANDTGEAASKTIQVELQNPGPIFGKETPNDTFDRIGLDPYKWRYESWNGGRQVQKDGRVRLETSSKEGSGQLLWSTWFFTGDFDIQVDYQRGEGWGRPAAGHIDQAVLGVAIDGHNYHITRLISSSTEGSGEVVMAWNDLGSIDKRHSASSESGKFRLIRSGAKLIYLYDIGDGWVQLGIVSASTGRAGVYLQAHCVGASQEFTTYYDNFIINSGLTGR